MESSKKKQHALRGWLDQIGILAAVASLVASLTAKMFTVGLPSLANIEERIWIPVALGAAVALLLAIFTYFLKREPSKVLQLRQKLVSAYVDRLAESIRGN